MILAGPLIMFFGDRRMPVRGGVVLRIFDSRPRSSKRALFGAGVLFAGVLVLLRAINAI
jgi:hypothetical protein